MYKIKFVWSSKFAHYIVTSDKKSCYILPSTLVMFLL